VNVQLARGRTTLISVAAVIVIIFAMQAAKVLLVPFLLAVFLSLVSVRPLIFMQRRGVPPVLAVILIVVVMMLILAVFGVIVGTSIAEFTAALPTYQARLDAMVQGFLRFVATRVDSDQPIETLGDIIDPGWAMGMAATMLNALRDVLTNTFLIFLTVTFILLEASTFPVKITAAFGRGEEHMAAFREFLVNLGRYLGIKTVVSLATGISAWLLTWAIGLDFPLLWGLLAFLLNYIPVIGSIIAAIPPVLLALLQFGPGAALGVAVGYMIINVTYANVIEPRMMGYGVGISPLVVLLSIVFWGWVFGPVGMLLSVPLTMTLKIALESNEDTRWVAVLLGSGRDAQHVIEEEQPAEEVHPDAEIS
jgi:AI-2 transport protein TqsA